MPALSKIPAITISNNKNGINRRQPISKDVLNSLIINAGVTMCISKSIAFAGAFIFAIFTNKAMSACLHCRSINSLRHETAIFDASGNSISSARYGLTEFVLILEKVGAIVYNVRNNARPINDIVGGIVCVVKARLTNDNTIIILANEVVIIKRLGKSAKPLKTITSLTGVDQSLPSLSDAIDLSITFFKSEIEGSALFIALLEEVPEPLSNEGVSIPSVFKLICP